MDSWSKYAVRARTGFFPLLPSHRFCLSVRPSVFLFECVRIRNMSFLCPLPRSPMRLFNLWPARGHSMSDGGGGGGGRGSWDFE